MSNRFFIIVLVLIVGFFGIFFATKNKSQDGQQQNNNTAQTSNHVTGKGTSGVTLIEYGDFQCPACGAYYPLLKQIKEKYGDQITFQFRNFPLNSHVNARQAHRAAEAADRQGKFWEMHDALYESQQNWSASDDPTNFFITLARQLKLNVEQFTADMKLSEVNDIINADLAAGKEVPVTATPTFVLNGQKLDPNPGSIEEFFKVIDDAIAAQKQ